MATQESAIPRKNGRSGRAAAEAEQRPVAEALTKLLAETYSLYYKTQSFHWNVTGPQFVELHQLFEVQYKELREAADEIAERVRALGAPAPAGLGALLELSGIQEATVVPEAEEMIEQLRLDNEQVMQTAHDILPLCDRGHDQVGIDLITRRMANHEKAAWMLRSLIRG